MLNNYSWYVFIYFYQFLTLICLKYHVIGIFMKGLFFQIFLIFIFPPKIACYFL